MKTPSRRHPDAFTLIELMTVITIMVILAGIVIAGLGFVNEKRAREQANVQISLLSRAIEEYKMDMGAYPGTKIRIDGEEIILGGGEAAEKEEGDYSQVLYNTLFYEGYQYSENPDRADANNTKATKIYIVELDPRNSKLGWVETTNDVTPQADVKITDPWGNNYRYRVGGDYLQNPDFDLWSMGKDGKTDPITKLKDDIRNF